MSDWCKEHHGKVSTDWRTFWVFPVSPEWAWCVFCDLCCQSGLTQAVRDSHITLQQAEYEFLSFVRQHTPPGQCPLAGNTRHQFLCFSCMSQVSNCASSSTGNSVHADKKFLDKFMPQFMRHLHYRIIDVSTIKELSRFVPHLGLIRFPNGHIKAFRRASACTERSWWCQNTCFFFPFCFPDDGIQRSTVSHLRKKHLTGLCA